MFFVSRNSGKFKSSAIFILFLIFSIIHSLLQNTLTNVENEIEKTKQEIRVKIDEKSDLLQQQIGLLEKLKDIDAFLAKQEVKLSQKIDKIPQQTRSLMISGHFGGMNLDFIINYFQQFGSIEKVTDRFGKSHQMYSFKYIFIKFDTPNAVDMAVGFSPHLIHDIEVIARRGKDY